MKKLYLLIIMAMLSVVPTFAYKKSSVTVNVNGKNRDVVVFVPDAFPADCPLMIVTHGMDQSPEYQYDGDKMYELIDKEKFVVAYPRSDGSTWDIGGTNDQNFIIQTIEKMHALHKINKARVYWSGFSMGSMLIYHCMPNMQDKIAAFAPTSGILQGSSPWNNLKKPVNLIHCHAYGDNVFGYEKYGIRNYVMNFKTYNKCKDYKKTSGYHPNGAWFDGDKEVWSNGTDGSEVELFSYNNGGHWPMKENSYEIWNFCKRFSLIEGPKIKSLAPENGSFDMDASTHRTFTVTLSKPADCSKVKATLTCGSVAIVLSLAETGESDVMTFTVPDNKNIANGTYKLKVTNIASSDGGNGADIEASYTYGIEEVGDELNVDTILIQDWLAQRETIGEGVPDGWKRVNTKSDGTDEQGQNAADVAGSRMKYFVEGGKIEAGFYLSAREYDRVDFTYGTYSGKTLILKKGRYRVTFRSTYWTTGAQNAGNTFTLSFLTASDGNPVFSQTDLKPDGCASENTGLKVNKCALHEIDFELPNSAKYLMRFSYAAGWNGIIIGQPMLTTAPSTADIYKGGFLRTMKKARTMLENLQPLINSKYGTKIGQLQAVVDEYDSFASISPSEYTAATAAVAAAMKPLENVAGIDAVEVSPAVDAPLYDLSGRRVIGTPQRGIYISGGKKVIF